MSSPPPPAPAFCPTLVPLSGNVSSVPATRGPGTAWVTVSPPALSAPSCPHPATATALSPLCRVLLCRILPRVPKPDPSQAGDRCHPAVPLPHPLLPTWHPGEPPFRVARWFWLPVRVAGVAVPAFSGRGQLVGCGSSRRCSLVVASLGQDRRTMAGSGRRCWRMKHSGMLLAWSG